MRWFIHGVKLAFERRNIRLITIYLCSRILTMDKGWMKLRNKLSIEYREGVFLFLEVAKYHIDADE